jgi:uncharacterized protein (TIGR02145 family)
MRFFTRRGLLLAAAVVVGVCVSNVAAQGKSGGTTFIDKRDGKTYKKVKIGMQTWMAENLNYQTETGSWCYDDSDSYCRKYGRLYDWETAKTACPAGWHLPSERDWDNLMRAVGGKIREDEGGGFMGWDGAGKKLKAKNGWDGYQGQNGNGTNNYGFAALPGGSRYTAGDFYNAGNYGNWWTATENGGDEDGIITVAYDRSMYNEHDYVESIQRLYDSAYSVRCIAD